VSFSRRRKRHAADDDDDDDARNASPEPVSATMQAETGFGSETRSLETPRGNPPGP